MVKRAAQTKTKKPVNPWKWGFLGLVIVIVLAFIFLLTQFTGASSVKQPATTTSKSAASFNVSLNKKQLNAMSDYYLDRFQDKSDSQMNYKFHVKNDAVVTGQTKVLGITVHFGLSLTPKLLKNGNVQFKAKKLAVGQLSVPVSAVMSYIKKSYNLPKWVVLDTSNKTITLNLNAFRTKGVQYRATKIDMSGAGKFEFKVLIPKK